MDARLHTQTLTNSGNTSSTEGNRSVCVRDGESSCGEREVQPLAQDAGVSTGGRERKKRKRGRRMGRSRGMSPGRGWQSLLQGSSLGSFRNTYYGNQQLSLCSPHKTTGTGWIHLLNISQEGKVVSQAWTSKSCRSPLGLLERLLCETSGPYWQLAVRPDMLPLWKTILCLCANTL